MTKWGTRTKGTEAQIGQKYKEKEAEYPYGTKRKGSGKEMPARSRSVDSMKSPGMSIPENQYQIQLTELNRTYIDGHIDKKTYEKARIIMTNHWLIHHQVLTSEQSIGEALITQGYAAEPGTSEEYGNYVAHSLHDGHGHKANIITINKPAHQVDLKLTTVDVDKLEHTQRSPDVEKRSDYFVDAMKRGQTIPPILVHKLPDGTYQVIDGHARVRAYQKMGIKTVPAVENGLGDILRSAGRAVGKAVVGGARVVGEARRAYEEGKSGKPRAKPKPKLEYEEEEESENPGYSSNPGNPGDEKWIGEAVEKPGSYTASVKRRYGSEGFTARGTIKSSVIEKDIEAPGKLGQRARLAKTLKKM